MEPMGVTENRDVPQARQKVLIVDDQPLNLVFAATELESVCQPLRARSGEEALELARREKPDLILLDVRMSGMDGFEVCRRLKTAPETADTPVIFLTVLDEETDEEYGLNLGAIDYINKPFNPALLRARVRNHLLMQHQRRQLERVAQIDGTTGIANRRGFDRNLDVQWQRHQTSGRPVALLLIDIDFFKELNDRCGHQYGDDTLKAVAEAIAGQMRSEDSLATRYGGDEFACILPMTDAHEAQQIAEQIREAVLERRLSHPGSPVSPWVTVSIGVSSFIPDAGESCVTLVTLADQSLYQAKANGRNKVSVF